MVTLFFVWFLLPPPPASSRLSCTLPVIHSTLSHHITPHYTTLHHITTHPTKRQHHNTQHPTIPSSQHHNTSIIPNTSQHIILKTYHNTTKHITTRHNMSQHITTHPNRKYFAFVPTCLALTFSSLSDTSFRLVSFKKIKQCQSSVWNKELKFFNPHF